MEYIKSQASDGNRLADLRAEAMKPSLVALGRFDENRVRTRFLETFVPEETIKLVEGEALLGFYVIRMREDHLWLDHLYIKPEYQNRRLGKCVLNNVITRAKNQALPIRLAP